MDDLASIDGAAQRFLSSSLPPLPVGRRGGGGQTDEGSEPGTDRLASDGDDGMGRHGRR